MHSLYGLRLADALRDLRLTKRTWGFSTLRADVVHTPGELDAIQVAGLPIDFLNIAGSTFLAFSFVFSRSDKA